MSDISHISKFSISINLMFVIISSATLLMASVLTQFKSYSFTLRFSIDVVGKSMICVDGKPNLLNILSTSLGPMIVRCS